MSLHLDHIEVRYLTVSDNKTGREVASLSQCLRTELGLKGVTSTFWGKVVLDTILSVFAISPGFWQHVQTHAREMWNMEQTARRLLKTDAKYFTGNQEAALAGVIQSRGVKFDRKYSYIYTDWLKKFHNYIQEPNYAIANSITIPSDDAVWYITIQLYPRIFYEDQNTGIFWRKGGIKMEKLIWNEDLDEWVRSYENHNNAKTIEIAWHCSETEEQSSAGVHTLKNDTIVKI
jgi:hypothetical protein